MVCDSVGIDPVPNNGTLRLPLTTIGLHDDPGAVGLDTPADPPTHTISTSTSISASPSTSTSTSTSTKQEPTTNPILVNPVSTSSAEPVAPTNAVGVDPPVPPPQPTQSPSDSSGDGGDNNQEGDDASPIDQVESSVKDFWDWFTGKVNGWWGKVTGHGKGSGEGSEEGGSSS